MYIDLKRPMGITVSDVPGMPPIMVTAVKPEGQGAVAGVRIGYFVREINGKVRQRRHFAESIARGLYHDGVTKMFVLYVAEYRRCQT